MRGKIAIISIATAIGLNNVLLLINLAKYSEAYREAAEVLYAPSFAKQIIYIGILIPIIEELLFRGVVFRLLRKKVSFAWSMILSALVFGLYHGNLVQFVYAGLCGLLLAYFYEVYGSFKAPVIAHVMINVTTLALTEVDGFTWMLAKPVRVIFITFICIATVFILVLKNQKMDKNPEVHMLRKC